MLRITVHEGSSNTTLQVEGMLVGPSAPVLEKCMRNTINSRPDSIVCVDLTGVTFIDESGKTCLARIHRLGATFIAVDCATKVILDEIAQSADQGGDEQGVAGGGEAP